MIDKKLSEYFSAMGRKSAKAKMKQLSPKRRQEIARNAAKARWAKGEETEEGGERGWEEIVTDRKLAGIYVRVSTVDQETDLQEAELLEYCQRRGWESILYRDRGQSGAKQDRPALNALLADLRKRKVDVILVWSLDRLARSLKQLLNIAEECKSLGVDLVSLRQNIDTTLPAGRLMFQVLGAIAEFERELLRERVKAGMAQARRSGKRIGRPALRHFGLAELARIRSLRAQGASVRKLATTFGTSQWMIAKILGSPEAVESVAA